MVTIKSVGLTSPTAIEQERCTSSLMWTEQAPHCATPQPYLVPVRPTCSRMTQRSGVSGSASTSRVLPLMVSLVMRVLPRVAVAAKLIWRRLAGGSEQIQAENASPAEIELGASGGALPTGIAAVE